MKKYILFEYYYQYPNGGLRDITGSYNSLELALKSINTNYDYYCVVDRDTWEIVWDSRSTASV